LSPTYPRLMRGSLYAAALSVSLYWIFTCSMACRQT
jgi:hypothetical protein